MGRNTNQTAPIKTRRRSSLAITATLGLVLLLVAAGLYSQRDAGGDRIATVSRAVIGDEKTAQIEGLYFSGQDKVDQLHYRLFGSSASPFPVTTDTVSAT